MAYVPGYEYDVFVSYAHVDDCILPGTQKGWVTTLVEYLKKKLAQILGREEAFSVWFDPSLPCHGEISPEIIETLRKSATILVVLSPGYVSSTWCLREIDTFLKAMEGKFRSGYRIFVVERDQLRNGQHPPEVLRGIKGFRFWEIKQEGRAPKIYGDPELTPGDKYYDVLNDLAEELAIELKYLKKGYTPEVSDKDKTAVYLAEVTDDLDPKRDEVERYLEQAGMRVLPDSCYSREPSDFRRCLNNDLIKCSIFVQLLSEMPGKKPPNLPLGYVRLQYDAACDTGMKIMQWRAPELSPQLISDPDHHWLLDRETVWAVGLEEFKSLIRENLDRRPAALPQPHTAFIFVNTERNDRNLADMVCEVLEKNGCGYVLPLNVGTPKQMRNDLEQNLLECDAIIILYGTSTVNWVREQLRQSRKVLAKREQDRPLKALAVFEGPPRKTCPLDLQLPGMEIIDSTENLDEAKLSYFLKRVFQKGVTT